MMSRKGLDITGKEYRWLTVLRKTDKSAPNSGNKLWEFKCICGKHIEATASDVNSERIVSCGCKKGVKKLDNLLGQKFGRLTPTGFMPRFFRSKGRVTKRTYWHCKCDCGNSKWIIAKTLKSGHSKSCGCLQKEAVIKKNIARNKGYMDISGTYLSVVRYGAKERGFIYDISTKYLWNLFEMQNKKCALSGVEITLYPGSGSKRSKKQTASIDRIDSSKGYINGNVQWVHKTINNMKQNYLQEDFIKFCKLVAKNNGD